MDVQEATKSLKPIIVIGVNKDNQLMVVGPFHKKQYCIMLLADAIKFVASLADQPAEPQPSIVTPK